jgi:RNA polymerase sigma factor (sigma-70 family)
MASDDVFGSTLQAARLGEEWAWTRIYRDLAPIVLGYLRARGAADPEDLTGEVFLQAVRSLATFEGDESGFRAWVLTIARHRLLHDRRTRGRRPTTPLDSAGDRPASDDVAADAERNVTNERIRRLIDRLSPDQRDVLLLRILGGLTVEEVAKAVGKRTGAVKALQRRGLAALEQHLAKEGVPL